MQYYSTGNEENKLIDRIHKHGFMGLDLHLINFDNQQIVLKIMWKKKILMLIIIFFNFEKYIKNLANIHDKISIIVNYYKPEKKTEYDDKKKDLLVFKCNMETSFLSLYSSWIYF